MGGLEERVIWRDFKARRSRAEASFLRFVLSRDARRLGEGWFALRDGVRAGEVSAGPAAGRGYASDAGRRVHRRANAEGRRTQNSVGGAETRSQSSVGESGITGESRQGLAFLMQVFHWGV